MKASDKHIDLEALNYKNAGFSVPQGYFDSIEYKVSSKLSNDIPTDYFENLEGRVFDRLEKEKTIQKTVKVFSLRSKFVKQLISIAAAASVILFIGLNLFNKQNALSFDTIDVNSISVWLNNNSSITNSYVLGEFLDNDDILYLSNIGSIEDTKLIEYLDQTDLEDIILID